MTHQDTLRLFVSFPETLVDRPMIYEIIKQFDVVPNIRRAERRRPLRMDHPRARRARTSTCDAAIAYLEGLGCTVNRMEGDVVAGLTPQPTRGAPRRGR